MFQQYLRFLWCLLLVGTTAWVPNNRGARIRRVGNSNKNTVFLFHDALVRNNYYNRHQGKSLLTLHQRVDNNSNDKSDDGKKLGRFARLRRWRRRYLSKRSIATTFFAFTLTFKSPAAQRNVVANAAPLPEQQMYSLRPGVTMEQARAQAEGSDSVHVEQQEDELVMNLGGSQEPQQQEEETATKKSRKELKAESKKKKQETFDYGEDDEDFDHDDDEDVKYEMVGKQSSSVVASASSSSLAAPGQTLDAPAGMMPSNTNMNMAYAKAAGTFVLPIFSFITIRGLLQERRNQKILKKAIDIMDAQRAEYFNVTSSSNVTDADIEDAIKGMKNETASDDEEEEDDEDDEDEDDEPPPPRRRPKGGGDGDGGDGDAGGPSEEDLDRLKNLFNKS